MAISEKDIIELSDRFYSTVMKKKGSAAEQTKFFLYPEARIIILHDKDVSLQENDEIHQKLLDEIHIPPKNWLITPLCSTPEKVRAELGRPSC